MSLYSAPPPPNPILDRSTALAAVVVALGVLGFPPSCAASDASGQSTVAQGEPPSAPLEHEKPTSFGGAERPWCSEVSRVAMWGRQGGVFEVVHQQCRDGEHIEICSEKGCQPDMCSEATTSEDAFPRDIRDGTLQSLESIPVPAGRDVLVVRRVGQGGYPLLSRYTVQKGQPHCLGLDGLESLLASAQTSLEADETFGFRGGLLSFEEERLVLIQGIYGPGDPSCCPSRGYLRIVAVSGPSGWKPTGVLRLPPWEAPEAWGTAYGPYAQGSP